MACLNTWRTTSSMLSTLASPVASSSRCTLSSLNAPSKQTLRRFSATPSRNSHENPLGLPRTSDPRKPPTMPRKSRSGIPEKRLLPNVKQVLAVSSCKGGVGKSTVSANLALALLNNPPEGAARRPRVGLLDLDIFGPSVPKLFGLDKEGMTAEVTEAGALIPLTNHGIPTMSMTYLLPPEQARSPIVWRGMMVQKAVQQLLFDVDWRQGAGEANQDPGVGLDLLVIDMPPGTGDVALTLTQLVKLDGAVVVSTPQEVALEDTRKGVEMFRKVGLESTGLVLNMAHYIPPPPLPQDPLPLFGPTTPFLDLAAQLNLPVLGQIPLEPAVSYGGDAGWPVVLREGKEGGQTKRVFEGVAQTVWQRLAGSRQ